MNTGVERSLAEISKRLEQALFAEQISLRRGLLQTLDPRTKLVGCLALILAANLSHQVALLSALYLLTLALAALSAIPLGWFVRRVALVLFLFTGLVSLPALFMTPGPAAAQLPLGLVVTQTGLRTVLYLLLRVSSSLSLTLLLVLSTSWASLLRGLSGLRLPDTLVLVLGMTYRYIHVLLRTANDMFLSRKSRLLARATSAEQRRLEGAIGGVLLDKSLRMGGEVYLAMQSRGFRGAGRTLRVSRLTWRDALAGALALFVLAAAVWLPA